MARREIPYSEVVAVLLDLPSVCRQSRRLRGWSMRELGHRAGVSYSVVYRLEGGTTDISMSSAAKILQALVAPDSDRK